MTSRMRYAMRLSLFGIVVLAACQAERATGGSNRPLDELIGEPHLGLGHQKQCDTVTILADSNRVDVGGTLQLEWIVYDKKAKPIPQATVSWSSSNPSAAAVSSTGAVTGVSPDTVDIVATCTPFSGFGIAQIIVQ